MSAENIADDSPGADAGLAECCGFKNPLHSEYARPFNFTPSYVVQTNGNLGSGDYRDLSLPIFVPGTSEGTTNYIHTNGATPGTRFYRVRLGP